MKASREYRDDQEPVGIVISSGSRQEEVPMFAAYVWGPVPDEAEIAVTEMAAA